MTLVTAIQVSSLYTSHITFHSVEWSY